MATSIAFGPTTDPALALAVIVENSGYGSRRAVPIARELFLVAQALGLLAPATAVTP
jgi:cell division protein FtsI/penicillin-binding protein 2